MLQAVSCWFDSARYVFYMVVFHFLSNLPIEQALFFGVHIRFWMQPNAITAIFVGVGMLCDGPFCRFFVFCFVLFCFAFFLVCCCSVLVASLT